MPTKNETDLRKLVKLCGYISQARAGMDEVTGELEERLQLL